MDARTVIEAETPKSVLKQLPPSQFEVDGNWQGWVADGQGNVLYDLEAQRPPRTKMRSIKKFNVEEYRQRHGQWPSGLVKLAHISYWDHRGNYFACGGEVYHRPRQEAQEQWENTADYPDDFQVLLFDYIEDRLKVHEFPERIKVKLVPIEPFLEQAENWGYGSGDNRARKSYQKRLSMYVHAGGKMPPILIEGTRLLDGRHRLIALKGKARLIRAIDLADNPLQEAEDPKRILRQAQTTPVIEPDQRLYYVQFGPANELWARAELAPVNVYDDGQCEFTDGLYELTKAAGVAAGEDEVAYTRIYQGYSNVILIDIRRGQTEGVIDGELGPYKWRLLKLHPGAEHTHFRYIPYHSSQVVAQPRPPKGWGKVGEAETPKSVFRDMQRKGDRVLRDAGFTLLSASRWTSRWYLSTEEGAWIATVEKTSDGSEWWELDLELSSGGKGQHKEGWGIVSLYRALQNGIIEAEDPKSVFKQFNRPTPVSIHDMDIIKREPGNYYPYSAMWKWPFNRAHPEIKGCPCGSHDTLYKAMADLVDSTNRESHTQFYLTFPNTPDHMVFNYKVGLARVPEPPAQEAEDPKSVWKQGMGRAKYQVVAIDAVWGIDQDGKVIYMNLGPNASDNEDYHGVWPHIVQFDLAEHVGYWGNIPDVIDISDIGFWLDDGSYDAADEQYRLDVKSGSIAR